MFDSPLAFCGQLEEPGLAVDFSQYSDFSMRETTRDQARIESVLAAMDLRGRRLLHIGVGNSQFARRFAGRGAVVEGVTVNERELKHAKSLNIAGYRVVLVNKYEREFVTYFHKHRFDFVIDNNMAAFACCKYHLYVMLESYLWCLRPGGKVLTDQRGMDWALSDPSFILDFSDLEALAETLPIKVSRETDMVYALEFLGDRDRTGDKLVVYALRRQGDGSYVESFEPHSEDP